MQFTAKISGGILESQVSSENSRPIFYLCSMSLAISLFFFTGSPDKVIYLYPGESRSFYFF